MQNAQEKKVPDEVLRYRKLKCGDCSCKVDFSDGCSRCPQNKWQVFSCYENIYKHDNKPDFLKQNETPPSIADMVKSAAKSAALWANTGFKHTDELTLKKRIELCQSCEFWNSQALRGTGRCMKCGCSTWAKLRMATEKCPIGKW